MKVAIGILIAVTLVVSGFAFSQRAAYTRELKDAQAQHALATRLGTQLTASQAALSQSRAALASAPHFVPHPLPFPASTACTTMNNDAAAAYNDMLYGAKAMASAVGRIFSGGSASYIAQERQDFASAARANNNWTADEAACLGK
jgi:hypothetical protein